MDDNTELSPKLYESAQSLDIRKLRVLALRAEGYSWSSIARQTHICRRQIFSWRQEPEWQTLERALLADAAARLLVRLPALVDASCSALDQALRIPCPSDIKLRATAVVLDFVAKLSANAADHENRAVDALPHAAEDN